MTNLTDQLAEALRNKSAICAGLEMMEKTFAHWIEFNQERGGTDESHVITPPVWPTIATLMAWIVALERAHSSIKHDSRPTITEAEAVELVADAFILYAKESGEAFDYNRGANNENIRALRNITTSCFVRCAHKAIRALAEAGVLNLKGE